MSKAISLWQAEVLPDFPKCPTPTIDAAVLKVIRDFCEHSKIWTEQLTMIPLVAYTSEYALTSSNGDIVEITHAEIDNDTISPTSESDLDRTEIGWRDVTASLPERYFMDQDRSIRLVYTPNEASDAYFTYTDLTFAATGNTITTAAGTFVTEGLLAGQTVTVSGSTSNNRNFIISSVTETVITVEGGVTDEGTADATGVFCVKGLGVWVALKPSLTATTVENFIYNDFMDTISDGARAKLFAMVNQPWGNPQYATFYKARYEAFRDKAARTARNGLARPVSRGIGA